VDGKGNRAVKSAPLGAPVDHPRGDCRPDVSRCSIESSEDCDLFGLQPYRVPAIEQRVRAELAPRGGLSGAGALQSQSTRFVTLSRSPTGFAHHVGESKRSLAAAFLATNQALLHDVSPFLASSRVLFGPGDVRTDWRESYRSKRPQLPASART
jgi:hypothetical protein